MARSLHSHRFFAQIGEAVQPSVRRMELLPKKEESLKELRARNHQALAKSERYAWHVLQTAAGLLTAASRIELAARLVRRAPSSTFGHRSVVRRDTWLDYHLSHFAAGLVSLQDAALVLGATVYQLGLDPRHCTLDVIKSHRDTGKTPFVKALKSLDRAIESHRSRRNRYLHRGEEATLVDYVGEYEGEEVALHLQGLALINASKPDLKRSALETRGWKMFIAEALPKLSSAHDQALAATESVLDALLVEFGRRAAALRRLTGHSAPAG